MNDIISIDLGTTNSCICYLGEENKIEFIKYKDKELIESIIEYKKGIIFYGLKKLIGKKINEIDVNIFEYKIVSNKNNDIFIKIDNEILSIEKLYLLYLNKLKNIAENYTQRKFKKCILTMPNKYTDKQREILVEILKNIGLQCIKLISEPIVVAIYYGITNKKNYDKKLLIYDLGGGTLDITKLNYDADNIYDIEETYCKNIGGLDFDIEISKYKNINITKAREYKETIKNNTKEEKDIYNKIIKNLMKEIIENMFEEINLSDIDKIILSGGGSKMYLVNEKIKELTEKEIIELENKYEKKAVAYGAMLFYKLNNMERNLILLDKIQMSIGIETIDGKMNFFMTKNTNYPTCILKKFTITETSDQCDINIYQGEYTEAKKNKLIGIVVFKLNNIIEKNKAVISIELEIDINGILHIKCSEKKTNSLLNYVFKKDNVEISNNEIELMEYSNNLDKENTLINELMDLYYKLEKKINLTETIFYTYNYNNNDLEISKNNHDSNILKLMINYLDNEKNILQKELDNELNIFKHKNKKEQFTETLDLLEIIKNTLKKLALYNDDVIEFKNLNTFIKSIDIEKINTLEYTNILYRITEFKSMYKTEVEDIIKELKKLNDKEIQNKINIINLEEDGDLFYYIELLHDLNIFCEKIL